MSFPGKLPGDAHATGLAIYCTSQSIKVLETAVNQHVCQPMRNDTCQERAIYGVLRHWSHPDCLADDFRCLQIVSVSYLQLLTQMK